MFTRLINDRDIAAVVAIQTIVAAGVIAVDLRVTGGVGLMLPLFSMLASGVGALIWIGRDRGPWLNRAGVLRMAWGSGLAAWVLGTGGYALAWWSAPESYGFSARALWAVAPTVGLLPGLSALALTLCAADTARTVSGDPDIV